MRQITFSQLALEDLAVSHIVAGTHFWPQGNITLYTGEGRRDNMLHYMTSGERVYKLNGRELIMRAGDMMLLPAGSCYESKVVTEPGSNGIFVTFLLTDEQGASCRLGDEVRLMPVPPVAPALLEEIYRCSTQPSSRLAVKSRMLELFSSLCCAQPGQLMSDIAPAAEHMHRHLDRSISLNELARTCHMSASSFSRRFRAAMGISPAAYHRHIRLEKARELLRSGLYTVEQTAQAVGFYDTAHFCRAYNARFGQQPGTERPR